LRERARRRLRGNGQRGTWLGRRGHLGGERANAIALGALGEQRVDWDRLDRGRNAEWARITAAIDGYELDTLNDAYARLIDEEHR
jgi:hypothetical protein